MAKQTGRSLQLSAKGRQKADIALKKFAGKRDLAAQLGMSPTTVTNFFAGRPVQPRKFHAICKKLRLDWQEVVDLPQRTESEPLQEKQSNSSDIDDLVREVRSRCCDKIQHLYSKIQLLNRQQIDVDKLYVDVYVLEKLASESYATIPDLLKGSDLRDGFDRLGLGKREKRSPGFEVAAHYPRLMILGKPGSGKSTFLRHLAVACCKGEFQADHIPTLVELRDIKDASHFNLLNKIHKEFGLANQSQTEQIVNQGKVLILLDGLDEVPGQSRRDVQDHIYEFSQQYYKNLFILTCRTQTTEYTLSTFDYVEVAEFQPKQVETFAQNWFTAWAETPEQAADLKVKFIANLTENKPTAELAVTPILLGLTCLIFNDLKDLPARRSHLYETGLNLLLKEWDDKRGIRRTVGSELYRDLSITEKKKLLSYVAYRKFEQEQYVLFEQHEIQKYIAEYLRISTEDSKAVLKAIESQHGLLIERAQGIWSFSHLTFQEYFTAEFIYQQSYKLEELVVKYLVEPHWREIFLLVAGLMKHEDNIYKFLFLLHEQAQEYINSSKLQAFLHWVNVVTSEPKDNFKLAAKRAIYIFLATTFISLFTRTVQLFSCAIKLETCIPALSLALALDPLLVNALASIPGFVNTSTISLPLHNKLHRYYARAVDADFDFGTSKNLFRYVNLTLTLAKEFEQKRILGCIDYTELITKLEILLTRVPDDESSFKVCDNFAGMVCEAWLDALKIRQEWINLSQEEDVRLANYLYTIELLVRCKEEAARVARDKWEEIEETLLLPIAEIGKR